MNHFSLGSSFPYEDILYDISERRDIEIKRKVESHFDGKVLNLLLLSIVVQIDSENTCECASSTFSERIV